MNQPFSPQPGQPFVPQVAWATDSSANWQSVRSGLDLIFKGILFTITAAVGLGIWASSTMQSGGDPTMPLYLQMAASLGFGIMIVMGMLKCQAVPAESGLKTVVNVALVCLVLHVAGSVYAALAAPAPVDVSQAQTFDELMEMSADTSRTGQIIGSVSSIASIVGMIAFLLFLRGLGFAFANQKLANGAKTVMILGIIAIVSMIGGIVALFTGGVSAITSGAGAEGAGMATMGFGALAVFVGGLLTLISFIWFMVLLARARNTIDQYQRFVQAMPAQQPAAY